MRGALAKGIGHSLNGSRFGPRMVRHSRRENLKGLRISMILITSDGPRFESLAGTWPCSGCEDAKSDNQLIRG